MIDALNGSRWNISAASRQLGICRASLYHKLRQLDIPHVRDQTCGKRPRTVSSATIDQATLTAAVAWYFSQKTVADVVPVAGYPALAALSQAAEALPEFAAAPYGDGTYRAN